jgi:hypothetical protein
MNFHGPKTDPKPAGDDLILFASSYELEHFSLARRQERRASFCLGKLQVFFAISSCWRARATLSISASSRGGFSIKWKVPALSAAIALAHVYPLRPILMS